MSTNERYGTLVWTAVTELDAIVNVTGESYWLTTRQIAKRAGVSLPTTRKYLSALVGSGHVASIGQKHAPLYALVKEI